MFSLSTCPTPTGHREIKITIAHHDHTPAPRSRMFDLQQKQRGSSEEDVKEPKQLGLLHVFTVKLHRDLPKTTVDGQDQAVAQVHTFNIQQIAGSQTLRTAWPEYIDVLSCCFMARCETKNYEVDRYQL